MPTTEESRAQLATVAIEAAQVAVSEAIKSPAPIEFTTDYEIEGIVKVTMTVRTLVGEN